MKPERVHEEILRWYDREKRDLPWRRARDPYGIWISEIMLQQTRVEAVLPYYARFLSNFPTVHALAEADSDRLLNLWAGLGYYSRARNLQAAAKEIVERFDGKLPSRVEDLRTLKGIGPYTAAAIASIAYAQKHAAIDGNLERVFARLLALRQDPKCAAGRIEVSALGEQLVQLGRPGEVNQAFMDLAARICLPKEPRCGECPLAPDCAAHAQEIQRELPLKRPKPAQLELRAAAWVVVHEGQLLLARRPQGEWLAGMWDLPWAIVEEAPTCAPFGQEVGSCSHPRTITKHKIHFEVRAIQCDILPPETALRRLRAPADEFRWVRLDDMHGINLPRPSEKALEKILPALM